MAPGLREFVRLSAIGPLVLYVGCRFTDCPLGIVDAVQVEVRDSVTSAPVAEGAYGSVQDGAFVDSLRPRSFDSTGTLVGLGAAPGRAGTYVVLVRRLGYQDWRATGVVARSGDCGVLAAFLPARLQPLP